MNGAHLHLLINHLPLFAVTFGCLALVWSMLKNSEDLKFAAFALFALAAIAGLASHITGDMAEDVVRNLPDIKKELIEAHDAAADFANISTWVLFGFIIAYFAAEKFKKSLSKPLKIAILIVALWSLSVYARTSYLGGQVRHTEIRSE